MRAHAVTAIGLDRPGIVAAVTRVLLERGCNLEDTAMSILRGQFASVLVVAAPDDVDAASLERALVDGTTGLDLVLAVREVHDTHENEHAGEPWTVVVHGADRPGIVHRVATALADVGANIVDLTTRVVDSERSGDAAVYSMVVEVEVPAAVGGDRLSTELAAVADELGVACTVHQSDADIL